MTTVLTVGHSNHDLDRFLALLSGAGITALADVRSDPHHSYRDHFAQQPLAAALRQAGIGYVYLGLELGGRPRTAAQQDPDGRARYDLMATEPAFRAALDRVLVGAREHVVALLCSEEDPTECHRRLLVGRALAEEGVDLRHLRADGSVSDDSALLGDGQTGLFEDLEVRPWRSARSVPRAAAPSPSSEH